MNPEQNTRSAYPYTLAIPTRWRDNDLYQHVNNVVYYAFFDTVIGHYLMTVGQLDYTRDTVVGFAVETHCQFFKPVAFPDVVDAGLRVGKIGNSSVRYEIGIFKEDEDTLVAAGYFVHVFVDRNTNQSTRIPDKIRTALEKITVS